MSKYNHYTAEVNAQFKIETFNTEKGSEKELKQKLKVVQAVAKSLGIEVWIDEIVVEE